MSTIKVSGCGEAGIIVDIPNTQLTPNAWSDGNNVRAVDGALELFKGYIGVYGIPLTVPLVIYPAKSDDDFAYWIYAGEQDAYVLDADSGVHNKISAQSALPGASTAALGPAGVFVNGTYTWKVTFVNSLGETTGGPASNAITITAPGTNGSANLTNIPIGPAGTVERRIYRSSGGVYNLTVVLADNTSTVAVDAIAAGSLGAVIPTSNTADQTYNANADFGWSATTLGGIPILNNGTDPPQMWFTRNPSNRMEILSNWPANTTCSVVKAYKQYLVALDITKGVTRYPYMVKWSSLSDPGTVPTSWNAADPTVDAAETELKEKPGFLIDCLSLRDTNIIYKEDSTYGMQYIGGPFVFRFYNIFQEFGIFARRCVTEFSGQHFLITNQFDIVLHDGQSVKSIATGRWQKWLAKNIDTTYKQRCFVVANRNLFEIWFCFVESGNTYPNKALVWHWVSNTFMVRDLPLVSDIGYGYSKLILDAPDPDALLIDELTYDTSVGTFDSDPNIHNFAGVDRVIPDRTASGILLASAGQTKLYRGEEGFTDNSVLMNAYVERTGLCFLQDSKGMYFQDTTHVKFITEVQLDIIGQVGTTLNIYIGGQYKIDDPVVWTGPFPFVIGVSKKIEPLVDGVYWALKIESTVNTAWKLSNYEAMITVGGIYIPL